jgi:long-chain acyl-CoA synthetase
MGTVGTPSPTSNKTLAGGSHCAWSCVFRGTTKPEATASTIRDVAVLGDAAFFDQHGQLVVIDRAKDVTALTNGTKFAPQFIENKLKFSPYIKEAVTIGQDRPYVTAMINIDMENVGKWAERRQAAYTTYTDLAQKAEVYALIAREVQRVNRDLDEAMQIKR